MMSMAIWTWAKPTQLTSTARPTVFPEPDRFPSPRLPLTVNRSAPKMTSQIELEATMSPATNDRTGSRSMLSAIVTDVHFWIPLSVLFGGLVLLDRLR